MTLKQAVKIAKEAMIKIRRYDAVGANLYKLGLISDSTTLSMKEYKKYTDAIKVLEEYANYPQRTTSLVCV